MRQPLTLLLALLTLLVASGPARASHAPDITNKHTDCSQSDGTGAQSPYHGFDAEDSTTAGPHDDTFDRYGWSGITSLGDGSPATQTFYPYIGPTEGVYSCFADYLDGTGTDEGTAPDDYGGRNHFRFEDSDGDSGPTGGTDAMYEAAFFIPEGTADALNVQLALLRWATTAPANGATGVFINRATTDNKLVVAVQLPGAGDDVVADFGDASQYEGEWFKIQVRQQFDYDPGSSGSDGATCDLDSDNHGACQWAGLVEYNSDGTNNSNGDWTVEDTTYTAADYSRNLPSATYEYTRLRAGIVASDENENDDYTVGVDEVRVTNWAP